MRPALLLLAAVIVAIGLLVSCEQHDKQPAARRQGSKERADQLMAEQPPVVRQQVGGGELLVIETRHRDGNFVESQRCYVWRDTEFKTTSMSCPADPDYPAPAETDH
jgi:hypothetical protein